MFASLQVLATLSTDPELSSMNQKALKQTGGCPTFSCAPPALVLAWAALPQLPFLLGKTVRLMRLGGVHPPW